jgi:DUF4097 and DUF4098 domain-containing protein YvlB
MERWRVRFVLWAASVAIAAVAVQILPLIDAAAETYELKRKGSRYVQLIDRSFEVKTGGVLHVEAPNGSIEVKAWDKNDVRVVVERRVKSRDEEEARAVLEDYPTTIEKKGNEIWVETEGWGRWGDSDRIEASYRMTVPRQFNVSLTTAGGSINVDDLDGDVFAKTAGGSIEVGDITGEVELKTAGGSIVVSGGGKVVEVETAGGSIDIGKANGVVIARTSGGSIRVDRAAGGIEAETAGGSITLGPSGGDVDASTAGGSIRIEATEGKVRASTAGGSISVDGSGGPVKVTTSGGSIQVEDARAGVKARTSGGSVSVELNVVKGTDATSELETAGGDVTVYLPEDLAVTIDARIDRTKGRYKIHSDFPLDVEYSRNSARARLDLGGGGDKIRLRTREGDIRILELKR